MLQPRRNSILVLVLLVFVDCLKGDEQINQSPRRRRQDEKDVTTVLLVDSHGKSSFGRYLNVKPDLGLITSTARTFIQEGVTTEYATQVLGTTLDNGRLYAHLLTKSSRVLYDDAPTKSFIPSKQKWNLNDNVINVKQFAKNTGYIHPSRAADAFYVFPTKSPNPYTIIESNGQDDQASSPQEIIEEEILKGSPTNNFRVPYEEEQKKFIVAPVQNNIKVFKISPQIRDLTQENVINHKENNEPLRKNDFTPSKVRPWDNLPTFTVRNEFSPSGLSFLGDFPDFEEHTERSKYTTPAERKAKLLFRAGLARPNPKDLQSITYTGFADFTTTVGDTVIVFTPHTSGIIQQTAETTKITVEPTLIKPTTTLQEPPVATKIKTFLSHEPPMETKTFKGHKLEMKTMLPTMVIDKTDRHRDPKSDLVDEHIDIDAKSAILAHEQGQDIILTTSQLMNTFTPDIIQPSESQPSMLSTPSDEDIAKIFASLQALAKQTTEPLNSESSIILENPIEETKDISVSGATTIFFDDDIPIETTLVEQSTPSKIVEEKSTTTTTEAETTAKLITTEKLPETTEKQETTTSEILTTSENIISTFPVQETTPQMVKDDVQVQDLSCKEGSQVVPSTIYKTLTYLTTFFIPTDESTSTSIKSNEVVSTEVSFQTIPCDVSPTAVVETTMEPSTTPKITEPPTTIHEVEKVTTPELTTEQQTTTEQETTFKLPETTPQEITTERRHVTESEPETTEATTEDGDEVELLFKTLYTTYTYLTTYFQDTTSSIASRIVVTTNIITSTLDPSSESTEDAVAGLFDNDGTYKSKTVSFDDLADITPTSVSNIVPTSINYSQDTEHEIDSVDSDLSKPTPTLNDDKVLQTAEGLKTYYTTYTYFTTIFVDGESEISSRTEVYTNFVNPSALESPGGTYIPPTKLVTSDNNQRESDADYDNEEERIKNKILKLNIAPQNSYNTINRHKTAELDNEIVNTPSSKEQGYVTLQRGGTTTEDNEIDGNSILDLSDYETIATMVTDVRSSTSEGDRRIIDNVDKRNVLDDQIVSESNNDSEIIPSPTLLLQTSYTTFTYFTTMYHGTSSSNVVSRLETITNVVTQTLTPTHMLSPEDLSLPITYFTTFTYWTTLYKDGVTKITSREDTVSNIETPTIEVTRAAPSISTSIINSTPVIHVSPSESPSETIVPSTVGEDELTTYFTTYTYYTTSYIGDNTVLNSRLETVTNVLNNTAELETNQIGRAIGSATDNKIEVALEKPKVESSNTSESLEPTGLLSSVINTVENEGTTTIHSTDIYGTYLDGLYAKVLESTSSILTKTIAPSVTTENLKPTGVVSINKGKIVDAEGVSTLFYTTQAVGTYIDNLYAQVVESTSSLAIDEAKKSTLPTDLPISHRTGLVRLIEGSIVQNDTTTFYQSRVLGTLIDGRYAQIIESTSSFLVGAQASIKPSSTVNEIVPTPTHAPEVNIAPSATISPSPVVVEGSISDSVRDEEETSTEEDSEEEDDDDNDDDKDSSRTKSRLTFQSKKRTFTPAIRPFASRQRPTFAPKRKQSGQSTAATITRSDFTPTVTAVPASKPNRFGGRRTSSGANFIQPTASGSRKFSRPKSSSTGGRRNLSSRIQPTASGFSGSSRRGGFRSSNTGGSLRSSSLFGARPRIRPTLSAGLNRSPSSTIVTQASLDVENDLTTVVTDAQTDISGEDSETTFALQTTTEPTSRRSQNPLLRFRRPPLPRPTSSSKSTTKNAKNSTPKKATSTTTTTTPKPRATFNRPTGIINRNRSNGLFPRRGLFTTTTPAPVEAEEEEVNEDVDDLEEEGDTEEDTDYDSSLTNTQTATPPTTSQTPRGRAGVQIKPFRRRAKRDTYSRFRRPPSSRTSTASSESTTEEQTEAVRPSSRKRLHPKGRGGKTTTTTTSATPTSRKRISPTKPGRTQFTLRNKEQSSSNKRPNARTSRPTISSRNKSSRLRNNYQTESSTNHRKPTNNNRGRTSSNRSRPSQNPKSQEKFDDYVLPSFDGTITVTHQIPTEVTIPVVSGRVTEYKNVLSAKYSTEVLEPRQYTTSLNGFGREIKVLLSEKSEIANNGGTLFTQFVLNEKPTTTVIFTPTYINRRKTSFSHVLPSTIYEVEQVVNTIQPALAAQAPLANILLSQLLLGGLQPQQNPLLLQQSGLVDVTPTTELKTRSTSYVTTVTNLMSTVIPLTFRGKEILTTILDSSVSVVTATEYITDTITVTPVLGYQPAPQLNTALLLPLLQQQLAQQQQQQTPNPFLPQQPANVFNLNQPHQALYEDGENLAIDESQEVEETQDTHLPSRRKTSRKGKKNKPKPTPVESTQETSIVTLYVSGKTPGEFTTVLSTVTIDEESNRRKREVPDVPVIPSKLPTTVNVDNSDTFDSIVMPAMKEVQLEASEISKETESLESIIGDVSKYLTTHTPELFNIKPTKAAKASKKYQMKYVRASEDKKASSGAFLA